MIGSSVLQYWFILTIIILQGSSSFHLEFDDYDSNPVTKYPCFGLGSRCDMTPECCSPAACVLPAWSPIPVCLIPGYKRLLTDLRPASPARTKDILHLKQLFNTSFFDHLLTGLPSSTPLEVVERDSSVITDHYLEYNGSRNKSNNTEYDDYENSTTDMLSNNGSMRTILSNLTDDLITGIEFNSSLQQLSDHIKNKIQFLIINSTIESNGGDDVIRKFNNTDRFKEVVILLEEKLKWLNQHEQNQSTNISTSTEGESSFNRETSIYTDTKSTTPKASKWSLVKAYFLKNKNSPGDPESVVEIETPAVSITTERYNKSDYQYKDETFEDPIIENIDSDERIKEAFRKLYSQKNLDDLLINNYDNINKIIDIDNETGISNEDIVEVYNIDIPPNLEQQNEKDVLLNNDETDQILSTLTKALVPGLENLQNSSMEETRTPNKIGLITSIERTSESPQKTSEKTHFWQKIYLWPVHGNMSERITKELKSLFVWKKRSKSLKRRKSNLALDENFILNFNSKNHSKNISDYSSIQSDKISSDYSIGYSTSDESTSSEDLYNSSYVFVVHKDNSSTSAAVEGGKWRNLFNIFHNNNVMQSSTNNNNDTFSSKSPSSNTEELNKTVIQKVVRLPEHLMPEALKEREINETDIWLFEDSKELEEQTIVEQRSSNGTFLFFFKW